MTVSVVEIIIAHFVPGSIIKVYVVVIIDFRRPGTPLRGPVIMIGNDPSASFEMIPGHKAIPGPGA